MFSGTLRVRDRLRFGEGQEGKVTAISVFDRGAAVPRGLGRRRADRQALGARRRPDRRRDRRAADRASQQHYFAPPTLETVVAPARPADKGALHVALDPARRAGPADQPAPGRRRARRCSCRSTARCRRRSSRRRWPTTSASRSTFRETTTICIERPVGTGAAVEVIGKRAEPVPGHGRAAGRAGARSASGVEFRLEVELGSMPLAFFKAVEETVRETLRQGLYGWQVTDCAVTMTHSGYCAAAEPRARHLRQEHVQHRRRLPQPDAAGPDGRAAAGRHRGVRADAPLPPRDPGRHARRGRCRCWRGCGAVPRTHRRSRGRRACWRARSRRPGSTSCSSSCRR